MENFWRTLHNKMLAALASGAFLQFNGYTVPGHTFQYRSIDDFLKLLNWVEEKAKVEEGTRPYIGRTFAATRRG